MAVTHTLTHISTSYLRVSALMARYLSYLPTYLTDYLTNESALAAAAETRAVSM